jgi:hypothetical protein
MLLVYAGDDRLQAERVTRILNLTGIDSRMVTQDWSCGYAATTKPYCVHIEAESDWKRAASVLIKIDLTPIGMQSKLSISLTLISIIVGAALIAVLSWERTSNPITAVKEEVTAFERRLSFQRCEFLLHCGRNESQIGLLNHRNACARLRCDSQWIDSVEL